MSDQEERKSKAFEQLFSDSPPIVHFKIPSVICALYPWKPPSSKQELVGDLFFTDKGVVFIQLTDLSGDLSNVSGLGMFGAIGGLAMGSIHVKRRKEALAKAKTDSTEVGNLSQILEKGRDVLFIPRATISKIRYSWAFGFQVNTSGKWQQFLLEKRKKTYRQYQSQIKKYLAT